MYIKSFKSAVLRSVDQNLKPLQMGLQMCFINVFGKVPASAALRLVFKLEFLLDLSLQYH